MSLISTYGYWVVLIGTALEGESVLILAGVAAHQGVLHLPLVMLAAFVGSLVGDQTFYWIGRRYGRAFIDRRPQWRARAEQAYRLLDRYGTAYTVGFRFLYGLRTVSPFAIGAAGMAPAKFTGLNVIGAAIWAVAFAFLGYAFSGVAVSLFERVQHHEVRLFAILTVAGLLYWAFRHVIRIRRSAAPVQEPGDFPAEPVIRPPDDPTL